MMQTSVLVISMRHTLTLQALSTFGEAIELAGYTHDISATCVVGARLHPQEHGWIQASELRV